MDLLRLQNEDNVCWINSLIQALRAVPEIKNLFQLDVVNDEQNKHFHGFKDLILSTKSMENAFTFAYSLNSCFEFGIFHDVLEFANYMISIFPQNIQQEIDLYIIDFTNYPSQTPFFNVVNDKINDIQTKYAIIGLQYVRRDYFLSSKKIIFDNRTTIIDDIKITIESIIVYSGKHYMCYNLNNCLLFDDDDIDRYTIQEIFPRINVHHEKFRPIAIIIKREPIIQYDDQKNNNFDNDNNGNNQSNQIDHEINIENNNHNHIEVMDDAIPNENNEMGDEINNEINDEKESDNNNIELNDGNEINDAINEEVMDENNEINNEMSDEMSDGINNDINDNIELNVNNEINDDNQNEMHENNNESNNHRPTNFYKEKIVTKINKLKKRKRVNSETIVLKHIYDEAKIYMRNKYNLFFEYDTYLPTVWCEIGVKRLRRANSDGIRVGVREGDFPIVEDATVKEWKKYSIEHYGQKMPRTEIYKFASEQFYELNNTNRELKASWWTKVMKRNDLQKWLDKKKPKLLKKKRKDKSKTKSKKKNKKTRNSKKRKRDVLVSDELDDNNNRNHINKRARTTL